MITWTEKHETVWEAVFENGIKIGEAIREVDGYFYWWHNEELQGFIPAFILRSIADFLDELNKEWNSIIQKEL